VCRCGCGLLPNRESVERLYIVRMIVKRTMIVSSAARCLKHNKKVKGAQGSIHLLPGIRKGDSAEWGGAAFDIVADADLQADIYGAALQAGFRGFGFASNFIHIDDAHRPRISRWVY